MKQIADGVYQLGGFPPNAINVFLINDVLVDASTRYAKGRILRNLKGHEVNAHALTHAHPDHQGASKAVCEELGIPYWVGELDADAAEKPELIGERQPDQWLSQLFYRTMTGPGYPVDRKLKEGDVVGGFKVLDVPGHSAGHVAFWREEDRVLIAGDVLNAADPLTALPGLREPKWFFTPDPARNRESIRKLGQLEPKVVALGHGPVYRDTRKFVDFCASVAP
ncbi:MAG: hydroxyacylglutathione hydrolase [Thermoleophilaceae bacterium]|nr:hydroxyacylglutathione hydrolase [Thermoleophilaceae bacterium]